jgi:hypothetical protein
MIDSSSYSNSNVVNKKENWYHSKNKKQGITKHLLLVFKSEDFVVRVDRVCELFLCDRLSKCSVRVRVGKENLLYVFF